MAKAQKSVKTNAMRILDAAKVEYTMHEYEHAGGFTDGVTIALKTGQPQEKVFKTLVTRGASKNFYVFVIPVAEELHLKKAAKVVGEKSIEMIHVAEITKITGYVRGGCSPIGMQKPFKTVIHESCLGQQTMLVSGGSIGTQIEIKPDLLIKASNAVTADIIT